MNSEYQTPPIQTLINVKIDVFGVSNFDHTILEF